MKQYSLLIVLIMLSLMVISCSGGGSNTNAGNIMPVSSGLKIFLTNNKHAGDFQGDPYLVGSNAFEKADNFCNKDPNKPDKNTYKALLVDDNLRSAVSGTDWVLQPNTSYYRSHNNVLISRTTPSAIFGVFYAPLYNGIVPQVIGTDQLVWTGIGDAKTFAAFYDTCSGWSDGTSSPASTMGVAYETDWHAFTFMSGGFGGTYACSIPGNLYCVQQP